MQATVAQQQQHLVQAAPRCTNPMLHAPFTLLHLSGTTKYMGDDSRCFPSRNLIRAASEANSSSLGFHSASAFTADSFGCARSCRVAMAIRSCALVLFLLCENERTNDGIQLHSPVRTPISTASLRTGLDWTSTMLLLLLLNSVCSGRTNLIRLVSAAASSVLPFGLCERMYERCRCLALSAAASSWSRSSIVVLLGSAK